MKIQAEIKLHNSQEIFTHKHPDGTLRTFLVGSMKTFAEEYPRVKGLLRRTLPIDKKYVRHIRNNAGIEQDRLDRMIEPYLSEPCIGVLWRDRSFTIIDGNHRLVKRRQLGLSNFRAHIFEYPLWEHFIMPDEVHENFLKKYPDPLNSPSRVLQFEDTVQ